MKITKKVVSEVTSRPSPPNSEANWRTQMIDIYIRTPSEDALPVETVLAELETLAGRLDAEDCSVVMAAYNRIVRRERGEIWVSSPN